VYYVFSTTLSIQRSNFAPCGLSQLDHKCLFLSSEIFLALEKGPSLSLPVVSSDKQETHDETPLKYQHQLNMWFKGT